METILVEREDGVVTVTLNRPAKRNAINSQMWVELLDTSGPSPTGVLDTEPVPWNGLPQSVALDLRPLEVMWLAGPPPVL